VESAPSVLELGLLLVAAVAAGWLARRIGLPAVVGYLVLGLAVSPFTPGYVADRQQLQLLADVGVVLLFRVGIEVDLWRLRREHGQIAWAAPVQVLVTTAISALVVIALGLELVPAIIVGLAIALSSSVAIVNITRSRRRTTDAPTERAMLGWSVVQDVTGVILAAVFIVALDGNQDTLVTSLAGYAAFAVVAIVTALLLPRVLRRVREQPDLFLLLSVGSGLAIAGIGSVAFHVPLALAAFIGGLVITEDPVSREARRQLLPFRDLFAVLFFVAVGALIDPAELTAGLGWLALFLALIVAAKVVPAYLPARLARISERPLQLAVGLGQVGEFSFVLAPRCLLAAVGATSVADLRGSRRRCRQHRRQHDPCSPRACHTACAEGGSKACRLSSGDAERISRIPDPALDRPVGQPVVLPRPPWSRAGRRARGAPCLSLRG
jgi:CPA2 family monovalent cation:H+ antiporter-2